MLILTETFEILFSRKARLVSILFIISVSLFVVLAIGGGFLDSAFNLFKSLKENSFWQTFNRVCIVIAMITLAYMAITIPIVFITAIVVVIRKNTTRKELHRDLKRLDKEFGEQKPVEYYIRKLDLFHAYRPYELDYFSDQPRWTRYETSYYSLELEKVCHELYRYASSLDSRVQNLLYENLRMLGYLLQAEKMRIYLEMVNPSVK